MTTTKTTRDLVDDLAAGKPILGQLLTALTSDNDDDLDKVITKNGYALSVEDLETALKGTEQGPSFDIRTVGGYYNFNQSTPADLVGVKLKIDPSNAVLSIGQTPTLHQETQANGNVTFTYGDWTYALAFSYHISDEDGTVQPITFTGSRTNLTPSEGKLPETEVLNGTQITAKPKEDPATYWASTNPSTAASLVATLFGTGFSVIIYAIDKRKKIGELAEKAKENIKRRLGLASEVAQAVAGAAAEEELPKLNLADFRQDIEAAVRADVQLSLRIDGFDSALIQRDAQKVAQEVLSQRLQEVIDAPLRARLRPVRNLLGTEGVAAAIAAVAAKTVATKLQELDAWGPYLEKLTTAEITMARKLALDVSVEKKQVDLEELARKAKAASDQLAERSRFAKEAAAEVEKAGKDKATADQRTRAERLANEVAKLEREAKMSEGMQMDAEADLRKERANRDAEANREADERRTADEMRDRVFEA